MAEPKMRFKKDDGSDYPAWNDSYIGDICKIQTGKSNTQDAVDDGAYPFYVRSPIIYRSNRYLFDKEAVITVGDGVGTGKVYHYVNGKFDLHQRAYAMTDFQNMIGKYFYYYFSSHFYRRIASLTAKTSVDSVRYEAIDKMKIEYPSSFEEQQKIADFLSSVDDVISTSEQEVANLETQKKAVMKKIFSQEVRFKRGDGTEFPGWEEKTVEQCSSMIKDGTHGTHKDVEGGHMLLSAKDIYDGIVHKPTDARRISDSDYKSIFKTYSLNIGDVLITIVGTLGRTAIINENDLDIAFQRSVGIVRPNSLVTSEYLKCIMDAPSFQKELDSKKSRGAQAGVYLGTLAEITIPVPCLEEQRLIANFLSDFDEAIAAAKKELELWKELKKGLLQQMFV